MSTMTISADRYMFHVKDPGSALTHFIGFLAAIFMTPVLLIHGAAAGIDFLDMVSLSIFMLSMILLYGASTAYHTLQLSEEGNLKLKRMDHMMIFVLIAGSYTPVCRMGLGGSEGLRLLVLVWIVALLGIGFKMFWVTCPKWVSSILYIVMGWLCITSGPNLISGMSPAGFGWLLAGGIIYTVGGIIYALKLSAFNTRNPNFGSHEIFHLFVMGGSICHFISYYGYLIR